MLGELRQCGAGRNECVVYLIAKQHQPSRVVDVVHPLHGATPSSYEVDGAWATRIALALAESAATIVGQAHSHPGGNTSHSSTDDAFPIYPVPGLVSIVVPNYAAASDSPWGVFVLAGDGSWHADAGAVDL
jgi:proteasome lid subunit RPN8/RPN11